MSSIQNLLPMISAHFFYLILAVIVLYLAYVLFSEAFRRRIFPSQVDRRVDNVVLTESGTRKVFTESAARPAAPPSSDDKTP